MGTVPVLTGSSELSLRVAVWDLVLELVNLHVVALVPYLVFTVANYQVSLFANVSRTDSRLIVEP